MPPAADPTGVPLELADLFAGGEEPPPGYVESATAIVVAKLAEYRSWLEVKSCA